MEEVAAAKPPSPGSQGSPGGGSAEQEEEGEGSAPSIRSGSLSEQEMFLPIANITRLMRRVLPANAKIAQDAKLSVQECVTEFIGFVTSEANDKCLRERRKSVNGDDLMWAMTTLGFDNYVESLKVYLHRYKELEGDDRVTLERSGGGPELPHWKDESGSPNTTTA